MKLIEQSKLFFKEANSDKVYEIDLCEVGTDLYVVNFRFGKRGANLKDGTKTPAPVGRIKAQALFTALEAEKRKKGYQSETEMFQELPDITKAATDTVEGTILQRLQDAIDSTKDKEVNSFKTKWKTSRVAWRVGVMRFTEAVPFLIKLVEKGDAMQRYSVLWALVRCGDERAIPTFKAYSTNENYTDYVRKIAKEGLMSVNFDEKIEAQSQAKINTITNLVQSLPPIIQEYTLNQEADKLEKEINLRVEEKQKDFQFLETLYLLVHVYPFLSKVILNVLSKMPLRPPFFKYIRSIYKLAEVRDDVRLLGMLAYRFEKNGSMYKSVSVSEDMKEDNWWYKYRTRKYITEINEQIADITKEVKKKDSKIGFSQQTKNNFQRRDLRRLKEYGIQSLENEVQNHNYVKLATAILLGYQKSDYQPAYTQSVGYSPWNRETRKYTHQFAVYPECASSMLLNLILNGHNQDLELAKDKWRSKERITIESENWVIAPSQSEKQTSAIERVKQFSLLSENQQKESQNKRNEFFPQKWDALPQAYIQLLAEGKLDLIHEFAYKNLKTHSEYENLIEKFDVKLLKKLLSSDFEIPAFFGVEICKDKLNENFDKELTLILLNSKVEEGRKLAQEIIEKNSQEFTKDVNFTLFVSELIFNQYADIRSWVNGFLQTIPLSTEKWQVIVGKAISEMLNHTNTYSTEILKDVQNILKTHAKSILENLGWNIVLELLENEILQNQVFASDILLIKSKLIQATDIPFSILNGFFESKAEEIRANGMEIFADYPQSALLEAHELLGNMLVSPYQNLRVSAKEIVVKLAQNKVNQQSREGKIFTESIVTKLVLALRKKDPEEIKREELAKIQQQENKNKSEIQSGDSNLEQLSVHKEIAELLITHFDSYLSKITLKTTLNLLHGNYREGQFVGFHILKNHIVTNTDKEEISIRQIVALAAHELLEIRNWTLEYYQNNLARIRYERDEALRILDAKWDDVRQKAMVFFRENFTENDWDVDSLVSIADSVRKDVEAFGKELITKFFEEKDGEKYLTMLSQHPSNSMQLFATNYLERFATGNLQRLKEMEFYFRCVLMQVNKGRIAKDRVLDFLEKEALSSRETAFWVVPLFNDLVATSAVQDKERFIQILQKLKVKYENLKVALVFE